MLNMFNISGRFPQPHAEQRGRRNGLIVHFGETFGAISSSLASLGKSAIQILSALKVCCAASASCRARHAALAAMSAMTVRCAALVSRTSSRSISVGASRISSNGASLKWLNFDAAAGAGTGSRQSPRRRR